jgi:hypothetical protein
LRILFRQICTRTWFEVLNNGAFAGWNHIGGSDTSSTGDTWYKALSDGAFAGWHQIGGSHIDYSVVGVGDFFGTGTDDILFRNNTAGDT